MTKKLTVCICGGGNSAHVIIPFLSRAGHTVNLFTRRPNDWKDEIRCDLTLMDNTVAKTFVGHLHGKSSDPSIVNDADAIILCMPVHCYRETLEKIAPFISKSKKDVFVGAIYGQAGFNWMFHEIQKEHHLTNCVCFAIGQIPFICRTLEYGSHAANFGGNAVNVVAVTPHEKFDVLNTLLLKDVSMTSLDKGEFVQACSFISLTLSVDNQIIHPARCYGLWKRYHGGKWPDVESVPLFYRDFDDLSEEILIKVDQEYDSIRTAVRHHFPDRPFKYMMSYLDQENFIQGAKHTNVKASFLESKQLGLIKTPTVESDEEKGMRILDKNSRFFTDDIPYGLLVGKWIGGELKVETPFIEEIILWAQRLRGEEWLHEDGSINYSFCLSHKNKTGIPPAYGTFSVEKILD